MVRVYLSSQLIFQLADKHLILSVSLINGLRHWRNENLEAAAEARHNRGQLTRRLYDLRLNKVSGHNHLIVGSINSAANQLNLISSFNCSIADKRFKFGNFT